MADYDLGPKSTSSRQTLVLAKSCLETARSVADEDEIDEFQHSLETIDAMLKQRGCEHFDSSVEETGLMTDLMDVIMFG